jgi:hypothetical protein
VSNHQPELQIQFDSAILWLDASTHSGSDDDLVATWSDISGNSNDVTAAGAARPTFKTGIQNSLSIMRFDGADDVMSVAGSIDLKTASTMYVVTQPDAADARDMLISKGLGDIEFGEWDATMSGWSVFEGGQGALCNDDTPKSTAWQVAVAQVDGGLGASSVATTWANLTELDSSTFNIADIDGNNANLYIGEANGSSQWYGGDIGEIVIFQEVHTAAQISVLTQKLMSKWGL